MKKTIDIDFYRNAKSDFIATLSRRNIKNWNELNNEISLYCSCFGLPVYVAIIFAEEEFHDYKTELEKKKAVVKEFYGYE